MDPDQQNDADPLDPDPQHWEGERQKKKFKKLNSSEQSCEVWIRNLFLRTRIQLSAFFIRIRIQLKLI